MQSKYSELTALFAGLDSRSVGHVTQQEGEQALNALKLGVTREEISHLVKLFDLERNDQ